ncbi:MAG: hypothetical protein U0904_04570, partial [Candidatus Nanopelagicales bacterium]|nr:hypothetical protein [Candidatus Nanopelagicales bacterium]
LSAGLDILANTALPEIRDGAKKLKNGAVELSEAVGSPTDPPIPIPTTTPIPTPTASITLVQAIRGAVLAAQVLTVQAETLATNLAPIFATIDTSAITSGTARDRADDAVDTLDNLLIELCATPPTVTPIPDPQCAEITSARSNAATAAADAGTVSDDLTDASVLADTELLRAQGIAVALDYFEQFLKEIRAGILEVSVALRSGSYVPGEEGLVEGLTELVDALRLTVAATKILDKGGDAALAGAKELAAGNLALSNGLDATDAGARQLTRATDKLAAGASEVAFGSVEVAAALKALTEGAGQATTGAGDLASGAEELQQQGTRKMLESVIESSQQPALANAWLAAASARAPEALPYGQPKGADGSAAYVMTMDPVGPSDSWAWQIAAILILGVSAVAGAALKQSLATRREERG